MERDSVDADHFDTGDLGEVIVAERRRLDAGEAVWLGWLVAFDRQHGWVGSGHLSCVAWLVDRCGMGFSTAKDKLRVAHELSRRPVVSAAYSRGELSYSKVRAITRVTDAGEDTDTALVAAGRAGTAADLERLARYWEKLVDQERPADAVARWERRGLRHRVRYDGMAEVEVVLAPEDLERLLRVLDAYLRASEPAEEAADGARRATLRGGAAAVDEASAAAAPGPPTWPQRRADALVDALVDLLELGVGHLAAAGTLDPLRCVVDVLADYDRLVHDAGAGPCELAGGRPLTGEAARRLACDANLARIITSGPSQVLDVGRATRHWNRAQRRAIRARHGHRCAVAACHRRITEIHHLDPWASGGRSDLEMGIPLCLGHHHLVHEEGWAITYNTATGITTLTARDGRKVTTRPHWHLPLAG